MEEPIFDAKTILILDDNVYASLDLAGAIEAMDGTVVGPVSTIADTLSIWIQLQLAAR